MARVKFTASIAEYRESLKKERKQLIKRVVNKIAAKRIAAFWKKLKSNELSDDIGKMPDNCKLLYEKFLTLKKQTRSLKKGLIQLDAE